MRGVVPAQVCKDVYDFGPEGDAIKSNCARLPSLCLIGNTHRWKQDTFTLIKRLLPLTSEQVVIVGGGVGGWIATLIAAEVPEKGERF